MQTTPGRPRRRTRLARALGLDSNPLRRASDRAEAWIRIGLLAAFLIAGPIAASAAGGWAYHAGITAAQAKAAPTRHVTAVAPHPAPATAYLTKDDTGGSAWAGTPGRSAGASAATSEVLAAVMTLVLLAFALLAALRVILAVLSRRRLAAWETAWSKVGPQWTGGRPG
jgi:hypothetical protein